MRLRAVLVVVSCCSLLLGGCGEEPTGDRAGPTTTLPPFGDLPFGIHLPDDAELLAEPLVANQVIGFHADVPERGTKVQAAFRVMGDDPIGVLEEFALGLGTLGLGPLALSADESDVPPGFEWTPCRPPHPDQVWCHIDFPSNTPDGTRIDDYASLQLWATDREPIVLLDMVRFDDDRRQPGEVTGELPRTAPPKEGVPWRDRSGGDLLFEEQGAEIRLPEGTRSSVPTLPVTAGTGGSFSILTTSDPAQALQALVDQAIASTQNGFYDAAPIETSTTGDAEIWQVRFVIPAGGWGFSATAIRPVGATEATIYVSSYAD